MHQSISPCIQTLDKLIFFHKLFRFQRLKIVDILNGVEPGENTAGLAGNARVLFCSACFFRAPVFAIPPIQAGATPSGL